MYIRVESWSPPAPQELDAWARNGDFSEGWVLSSLSGPGGISITLWSTHPAAVSAEPSMDNLNHYVYQVRHAENGNSGDRSPSFAYVVRLHGPRSIAQASADERDGRERIWPAIRDTPGLVRIIAGVGPDRAAIVVALTTDVRTIDRMLRTIKAAPLPASEDPALLTAPDRIEICAVTAGARSGAAIR